MRIPRRELEVHIGTLLVRGSSGLHVDFKAEKSLKPEPNTCELTIHNLTAASRNSLLETAAPVVSIFAQGVSVFYGQVAHVVHERADATTIATRVSTSDGGDKVQTARIKKSFGPRAKTGAVLRAIVKELGVDVGNLAATAKRLDSGEATYAEGVSLNGSAAYELTALCRSAGLEWSIQDGVLQLLNVGEALKQTAIVLRPDALLNTPSVSSAGIVAGKTFLQAGLFPGRQVQIHSEFVDGAYRLEKCTYVGNTSSDEWSVDFEAKGKL